MGDICVLGILSHAADLLRKPWGGFTLTNVYAKTREECEEKLAVMIEEVKKEIAMEKDCPR